MLEISSIKAPKITLIAGSEDKVCPYATAQKIRDDLGDTLEKFITIDGKDHLYFGSANDDAFITDLTDALVKTGSVYGVSIALMSILLSTLMLA